MTFKKDLKRRVRERQARTGESYTAARAHVVAAAERPPAIPVEEMIELREAGDHGFRCAVLASKRLLAAVDARVLLERLHGTLLASASDPSMQRVRAVGLRGERLEPSTRRDRSSWWHDARRFVARLRAGIGGVTESGEMFAIHVDGRDGAVLMLCVVGSDRRAIYGVTPEPPRLFLATADSVELDPPLSIVALF